MFVIEADQHAEELGRYMHRADAITELRRLARLPWDEDPNRAPCQSWRTCGRSYVLIAYDISSTPWRQIDTTEIFHIGPAGIKWSSTL
ncbi:Uncharacterised protein [Mycobacteroides abscessus subsp. massiliense]|nr:Uncharacterised protein [Mycobacteroides abscessus subsp. massiliense]